MKERELSGNKMFEMVKEECQRILGKLEEKGNEKNGVLYFGKRNGENGFYTEKWGGVESEDNRDFSKYEGEIKIGFPNGQGILTFPDGEKYVGEFKDGTPNGQGTFTSPDGKKYVGEHKDGKMYGQGTFTWNDGSKYVGGYKDGEYHGQGTHTWSNGGKYVGEYKDGKKHGQGTLTFPDGEKYVGELKDGEPWNGIVYDKNGNIQYKFVIGKLIKP